MGYFDLPPHSEFENDASDLASVAGPSSLGSPSARDERHDGSPVSRKRRKTWHEYDPSNGDRFIASRSVSGADPNAIYRRESLDHGMKDAYTRVTHDGRMFIYGNATQMQVRYQNVLSSVIIPHANSDPISDSTSEILQRRGLTPTRSKLFSYFSTPPSAPSSPTPHATPTGRTPLGETTDAPKFRPAYWSDNTIQYLTEQNKPYRAISPHAYKVLDAPEIEDNFYLNLVDWGTNDRIAVALKNAVYLYDVDRAFVTPLDVIPAFESPRLHASALKWIGDGSTIAWGNRRGDLTIYDTTTKQKIKQYSGHLKRVGVIDACGSLVASGSEDSTILIRDVRLPRPVTRITAHNNEVCGLKFSPFDDIVLASGGNDNKLFIWDLRNTLTTPSGPKEPQRAIRRGRLSTTPFSNLTNPTVRETVSTGGGSSDSQSGGGNFGKSGASTTPGPLFHLTEHRAAVRGLAWSPHTRGLLASGGGRQDPIIRFWNTSLGYKIDQLQCHAQVTNLSWSTTTDELLSTHGFPHQAPRDGGPQAMPGVVTVWHYPTRVPNVSFAAHSCRVSYLAVSPKGQSIVTASGDETLRFFSLFPAKDQPTNRSGEEVIGRVR